MVRLRSSLVVRFFGYLVQVESLAQEKMTLWPECRLESSPKESAVRYNDPAAR
jgi:hypothetical protein